MKLTDTKQHLSQVVSRVARGETRVVVEKSGLPVVAIISAEEYRRFKAQEQEQAEKRATLFEAFSRFSQAFDDVSDEELECEIAKAQAEVRADRRPELERMIAEAEAQTLQPSEAEAPANT
jgi:prevent-host-death family protein